MVKKWILFLIIIFAAVFSRNFLFSGLFRYEIIKERKIYSFENENFNEDKPAVEVEKIIQSSLEKTSSLLAFSFDPCENDPNLLLKTKKANCIGYSALLAALIQTELRKNKLDKEWKVSHEVGEIYFLNQNINQYFTSTFFKDHDFVVVENKETKERIAIDAALYDYFRINKITLK